MKLYFAPLEGITGFAYRNVHRRFFGNEIDKYFSPFAAPNYTHHFKNREREDIDPANNPDVPLVPQILTNRAEDFLWAAEEMYRMGYREINLNLGCPMPTVVKKGRGSGQLGDLDALDRFLEEVCRGLEKELRFTVKTRIGLESADSAAKLLEIYNRYPIAELTVHPRTQRDLYGGTPDLETFSMFLEKSVHPVVYNGDIFSVSDYERICARFPGCSAFMLGRGLIANPALARELCCGAPLQKEELRQFQDAVYKELKETLPGQAVLIGKMKELWFYMGRNFADADRFLKEIRKAKNEIQYRSAVRVLFANCPFPASGHTEANVGE